MGWRLASKMQLIMAIVLIVFVAGLFGFLAYRQGQRGLEGLEQQARIITDELIIFRQWLADNGGVWVGTPADAFAPQVAGLDFKVPAVVTSELSRYTERTQNFKIRITSLKPLNPSNNPTPLEREALEMFVAGETGELKFWGSDTDGEKVFQYIRPLYTEASCLNCHDKEGYQVGDVLGALSLSIPAGTTLATIRRDITSYLLLGLVALVAILLTTGFVIWWLVARPLHQIEVATRSLAVGNLETRVEIHTGDELQTLGDSLNSMAVRLSRSYTALERLTDVNISMEAQREKLQEAVIRDGLTGLYNHRHFRERLRTEIARSSRENTPLSLLMADIDRFKNINDNYGHLAGDKILTNVARLIQESIRESDIPARYGGEEFALILPGTSSSAAQAIGERLRKKVESNLIDLGVGIPVQVTISIGVATFSSGDDEKLILMADRALYSAKKKGRNRVMVADWQEFPKTAKIIDSN
ncbi:MAG TPA: diguanylate cyclase [Clostridia bacterium]|nr:diguanylate cyclase [Clostridia bacterium]